MGSRLAHRRSSPHALVAWLCVAFHLAVFSASGWHAHGGHGGHAAPEGAPAVAEHGGVFGSHGQTHETPRDGRDPEGCVLCDAILASGHGVPPAPVVLVLAPRVPLADRPTAPRLSSVGALGRPFARGPPAAPSASPLHKT